MDTTFNNSKIKKEKRIPSVFTAAKAVFKKELRIGLRYPTWFISLLIWPIIFPLGSILTAKALSGTDGSSLTAFSNITGSGDYITFMLIGTTMWMWVNTMLWSFGSSLRTEQVRGTLESNWLCPVPKISILLGYSIFDIFFSSIYLIVSILEFKLVYNFKFVGNPLIALLVFIVSIPAIYGIGFIFASLVMWAKETNAMVFLVRGLMTIFCGITYPLATLPNWMQNVSKFIPLTYSINALRAVITSGASIQNIKSEIIILLISGVVLMTLGLLAFNYTQKKAKNLGSLGQY